MKLILTGISLSLVMLTAGANTQTQSETVIVQTQKNGNHTSTHVKAYRNGKKLDKKESDALANKIKNEQTDWHEQFQAFDHNISQWAGHMPSFAPQVFSNSMPQNLYIAKQQVKRYHDSGQYISDIRYVTMNAANYLSRRVYENRQLSQPKKLAVVFDIDETTLSNYPAMVRMNFGCDLKAIIRAEDRGRDSAITPTLNLFNLAKKNHVAIFFITGRKPFEKAITIKNLRSAGFSGWTGIYFKPANYRHKSTVPYKAGIRQKISKKGYDIVFSMGDQYSDLKGGYADMLFKLPNPFYFIP